MIKPLAKLSEVLTGVGGGEGKVSGLEGDRHKPIRLRLRPKENFTRLSREEIVARATGFIIFLLYAKDADCPLVDLPALARVTEQQGLVAVERTVGDIRKECCFRLNGNHGSLWR